MVSLRTSTPLAAPDVLDSNKWVGEHPAPSLAGPNQRPTLGLFDEGVPSRFRVASLQKRPWKPLGPSEFSKHGIRNLSACRAFPLCGSSPTPLVQAHQQARVVVPGGPRCAGLVGGRAPAAGPSAAQKIVLPGAGDNIDMTRGSPLCRPHWFSVLSGISHSGKNRCLSLCF